MPALWRYSTTGAGRGLSGVQGIHQGIFVASQLSDNRDWATMDKATKSSDTSGMKVCVTLPGRPPRPAEIWAKENENLGWGIEEGDCANLYGSNLLKPRTISHNLHSCMVPSKVGQKRNL